jgi:hypothetical protein
MISAGRTNVAVVLFAAACVAGGALLAATTPPKATTGGSSRTPAVALKVGAELSPGWTIRSIERQGSELRVTAQRKDGENVTFNVSRREAKSNPSEAVRRSPFDVEGYSVSYEQTSVPMEGFEAAGRALGAIITAGGDLSKVQATEARTKPVAAAKMFSKVDPAVARGILRDMAGKWTGDGEYSRQLDFDGTLIVETGTSVRNGKNVQSHTLLGYNPLVQRFWITHTDSANTSMWSGWGEWNETKKTLTFDLDPTSENKNLLLMHVGSSVETAELQRDGKTEASVTLKKAE